MESRCGSDGERDEEWRADERSADLLRPPQPDCGLARLPTTSCTILSLPTPQSSCAGLTLTGSGQMGRAGVDGDGRPGGGLPAAAALPAVPAGGVSDRPAVGPGAGCLRPAGGLAGGAQPLPRLSILLTLSLSIAVEAPMLKVEGGAAE